MSARDFMGSGFRGNRFVDPEESDPRVGLVNLADVMLVFACGLMVALVAHWNVDLSNVSAVEMDSMTTEISESDFDAIEDDLANGSGNSLSERGTVYEDPTTGQLYLIEKVHEEDGAADWTELNDEEAQKKDAQGTTKAEEEQ